MFSKTFDYKTRQQAGGNLLSHNLLYIKIIKDQVRQLMKVLLDLPHDVLGQDCTFSLKSIPSNSTCCALPHGIVYTTFHFSLQFPEIITNI